MPLKDAYISANIADPYQMAPLEARSNRISVSVVCQDTSVLKHRIIMVYNFTVVMYGTLDEDRMSSVHRILYICQDLYVRKT